MRFGGLSKYAYSLYTVLGTPEVPFSFCVFLCLLIRTEHQEKVTLIIIEGVTEEPN